jgi:hypothetical protein
VPYIGHNNIVGGFMFVASRRRRQWNEAASMVVVSTLDDHRRWGGSVSGHQVHYRDRDSAYRELC